MTTEPVSNPQIKTYIDWWIEFNQDIEKHYSDKRRVVERRFCDD